MTGSSLRVRLWEGRGGRKEAREQVRRGWSRAVSGANEAVARRGGDKRVKNVSIFARLHQAKNERVKLLIIIIEGL